MLGRELTAITEPWAAALQRLDCYTLRVSATLAKVKPAQPRWIDAPDLDSSHSAQIQLHGDLLATVGMHRGTDG